MRVSGTSRKPNNVEGSRKFFFADFGFCYARRQPASHEVSIMTNTVARTRVRGHRQISLLLVLLIIAAPVAGQRPAGAPPRQTPKLSDPTFETLLATDAYKMYGEVRNVGQLLSTGGAGEIVDPIIKLADPGKEFKSIVSFLKKN